jgi:Domain of unknown function (DUF4386)
VVLFRVSRSAVVVALAFGVLGMAAYLASRRPVAMLQLARSYAKADATEPVALLSTGEGLLATWTGRAFEVYYIFNLVTLLVMAVLMYRSQVFGRPTAVWGLVAAALMAVPSNFGAVGLVFALASLVPWAVFALLVARRLFTLAAALGSPDHAKGGHATLPQQGGGGRRLVYEFWQTPLRPVARCRQSERVGSDVGSDTAY